MKKLVVLVGLPGSGKTAFRKRHPEWAVVSREAIRREVFHSSCTSDYEDVVERIVASTLVEVVDSDAEVVCVDDLNLTREARRELIELARLAGRRPVAYVMPAESVDELYARAQRDAERLSASDPDVRVTILSRDRFVELVDAYDPVDEREGFARVERETGPVDAEEQGESIKRPKRKRLEKREPLPLFVP